MFRAIGIGQSRSLASSAAFNWILKDGLGRLCRCIYTASLASAFDTNLKRVRFSTSLLFSLSIGVELMTPLFPRYFLLLASIANIAKQISLSCYLATGVRLSLTFSLSLFEFWCSQCFPRVQSAVHRSFAVADNLGEVSAKAQVFFFRNLLMFFIVCFTSDFVSEFFRFKLCVLITLASYLRFF